MRADPKPPKREKAKPKPIKRTPLNKTLKEKKCAECKNKFKPSKPLQTTCSISCAIAYGKKLILKKEKTDWKEKKKELILKTEKWNKKLAVRCQEIARLIDFGLPCLARGNHPKQLHGGHVFSKGSNSNIKYNLHNIHRQSAQSNHFQADDTLLREGVAREYGQDYMDFIASLKQQEPLKFNQLEYHFFYQTACKIANRLKKDKKTLSKTERIDLRNAVNIEIGIYPPSKSVFKPA